MQRNESGSAALFGGGSWGLGAIVASLVISDRVARADEDGVSFWLPGQFDPA
jgi:hypothetical protein